MISILVPAMASLMPCERSRALAASMVPTKSMALPPLGSDFFISSPAWRPAATLSVPMYITRLDLGASASWVNRTAFSATRFRMSLELSGSTGLIETPATFLASRSSRMRFCSAADIWPGMYISTL